mgnify:FL=1|tara:strand:- start:10 stop:438 length:429 start_codon:yes stop_codon:yes gene_type:complete
MKKEKMVLYLGYAALALIGLYFTVGILKISGEGLAKLGYPNNFIREGFSEKTEEVFQKKIDKILKQRESFEKMDEGMREQINGINDMDGYSELIDLYKQSFDTGIRAKLQMLIINQETHDVKKIEPILKYKQMLDLLENYTI